MTSDRYRALWDDHAASYDQKTAWLERRLLGPSRPWVCSRASGRVLELGIGTGANIRHYPAGVRVTGLDWSAPMLAQASDAAARLRRPVELVRADAGALPFEAASFDTVVATYLLCSVADVAATLGEVRRVLVDGGRVLLADHVSPTNPVLRWGAEALESFTAGRFGERFTRRPSRLLAASGFTLVESERTHAGIIERVHARAS